MNQPRAHENQEEERREDVSPPMPRGKPALGNEEVCPAEKTDNASDNDPVSPPMPRGKPAVP